MTCRIVQRGEIQKKKNIGWREDFIREIIWLILSESFLGKCIEGSLCLGYSAEHSVPVALDSSGPGCYGCCQED